MKIGLFIPCYIDQFYPQVGIATLHLLKKLDCDVSVPLAQTCCGQPLANSGLEHKAKDIYHHLVQTFAGFDYVVAPSASCVYHIRHHYDIVEQTEQVQFLRSHTLDITEFLTDILQIQSLDSYFPHKVGLHRSCHGLRGLRLAKSSELIQTSYSKWEILLGMVQGLELVPLDFPDECCGFGGTFSVFEEAVSAKMGKDRISDHHRNGAEYITAGDMSCLMHLEGIIRRNKNKLKVKHLVEILNGT